MRITKNSYDKMNQLMAMCFDANAVIDNLAYNLDYNYFNEIAKVVHLCVAHVMPEWADLFSEQLLVLSARPVRKDINGYEEAYEDLSAIFNVLVNLFSTMRDAVCDLIETADLNGDDEIRIFGEDFLKSRLEPFIKQAEEWAYISRNTFPCDMNIHIKNYTHFIKV